MRVFTNTDIGLLRSSNQDTYKQGIVSETCAWSVVCDGMGGVNGGNIASSVAADKIEEIIAPVLADNLSDEKIKELCLHAVNEANSAVFSRAVDEPDLKGMGTTTVLAVIRGSTLFLTHVGDSRAYLKTVAGVKQITIDHSYVQDLINRGELTKEAAKIHPHRNIITRSVGVHSMVETDYQQLTVAPGEIFISCSDGLSNYLTEEQLGEIIDNSGEEEIADVLIQHALSCGGSDNVTVSVIYI